ncbi:MAG: hypothetical protein C5B59_06955 [Bacteroidetes bacterium]|nr:MAG: hypothetical protein C5B59_06955 [Bacteroidota bacterium]
MFNITLICTRHEELGACNSNELYQIIAAIHPEVIFEEIPPSYFDKYYTHKSHSILETEAVNKYLETHNVRHIPVDSEHLPFESFLQDHTNMNFRIEGLADIHGFTYRKLTDIYISQITKYGFKYLNSVYCDNYFSELDDTIVNGLKKLNDDRLFQTYKIWEEIHDNRENEIIGNIYHFSQDHSYNRAICMVEAGHRKSIIQKIQAYETAQKIKLSWSFYNYEYYR